VAWVSMAGLYKERCHQKCLCECGLDLFQGFNIHSSVHLNPLKPTGHVMNHQV